MLAKISRICTLVVQRKAIGMKRQKRKNEPPILLENSQHRPQRRLRAQRKQCMFFSLRPLKIDLGPSKRATGFLELSNASAVEQIYRAVRVCCRTDLARARNSCAERVSGRLFGSIPACSQELMTARAERPKTPERLFPRVFRRC